MEIDASVTALLIRVYQPASSKSHHPITLCILNYYICVMKSLEIVIRPLRINENQARLNLCSPGSPVHTYGDIKSLWKYERYCEKICYNSKN